LNYRDYIISYNI